MIIIALFFVFTLPIITFVFAELITKKERQASEQQQTSLPIQFVKAAIGFKIATIVSVSMPFLLLFPFLFDKPTHSTGDDLLIFLILLSVGIIISSLCCINSYNYLFYTTRIEKAFGIMFIPFIPIFIIAFLLAFIAGGFIGVLLVAPYEIILIIMAYLLYFKRKQFNKRNQNNQ